MTTDTKPLAERSGELSARLRNCQFWMGVHRGGELPEGLLDEAADALDAQAALLSEAAEVLEWYEEKARNCRKLGGISEGEEARNALSQDGGDRARSLLSRIEAMK